MSVDGDISLHDEYFESTEHQAAFVFAPGRLEDVSARPAKRRKTTKARSSITNRSIPITTSSFEPLLGGVESQECAKLRQHLFERCWADTNAKIQSVLDEANEGTLAEVETFLSSTTEVVQYAHPKMSRGHGTGQLNADRNKILPAGFIATGPNISSQELLFTQLLGRLRGQKKGPTVLLRSGDASNLKNILKQIIRDSTNQKDVVDDEEVNVQDEFGRKFLNYDLEILHKFIMAHGCERVVLILQDSEAFDSELLSELIRLFSSWKDRIPFVLLFGVATSVALFHERLPRAASRCLCGVDFNVENTDIILDRIFKKTVASATTPIKLGGLLIAELMERQKEHIQSVQAFTMSLKYAYMSHFYGNALSILVDAEQGPKAITKDHLEAIRILPSFRILVEEKIQQNDTTVARAILKDEQVLLKQVAQSLIEASEHSLALLRNVYMLSVISPEPVQIVDIYLSAVNDTLSTSDILQKIQDSIYRKTPQETIVFLQQIISTTERGSDEMNLEPWHRNNELVQQIQALCTELTDLIEQSKQTGDPLRSAQAIHSKGLRTTVIAQRVQLTHEKSTLSKQDQAFMSLVQKLSAFVKSLCTIEPPTSLFLHEAWMYDSTSPYMETFTPRPRHALESALTSPHNYLQCECCKGTEESLSASQPATAILYQMCLQAGSLINIADLWSTFLDNQRHVEDDGEEAAEGEVDEREVLVKFYRGLSELKQMGVLKQSKKKVDHLAKVLWKGL